ncbi:MAG TPA: GatB/YqeY domain-containing protein [Chloroflexota bacterium]|nr:GatB/YqeY domain-containing protein [Chloroflexota bacterium]
MSELADRLQADMTAALKARDELRLSTLRMVRSALQYARVAKRADLTEDDVLAVLAREAKQRRESAEEFTKGNRPELAAKEEAEGRVIAEYLPRPLSDTEIEALLTEAVGATGATSPQDLGKVMSWLSSRVKGRVDGRRLSELVRQRLQ